MTEKRLTTDEVRAWVDFIEPGREFHYTKALDGLVHPSMYDSLRKIMYELVKQRVIKPSGMHDGVYKKIQIIEPVKWWEADSSAYYDITHPHSIIDLSTFGWGDIVNISSGDCIVVAGVSNFGKSSVVLNYLARNIDTHQCLLMGNEYTTLDGMPSPKFKRRIESMNVNWFKEDGSPKFELLPVSADYDCYVQSGKLNIIDWINEPENPYMIGRIMENIKKNIGDGIAVIVVQKNRVNDQGVGGQFTEHFADMYLSLDPYNVDVFPETRITLGKVKDTKQGVRATGRSWVFSIRDNGANLNNIREVTRCKSCYGKGYTHSGKCPNLDCVAGWVALDKKYIDEEAFIKAENLPQQEEEIDPEFQEELFGDTDEIFN